MATVSRQLPSRIGRYRVLGRIASGGMGTVHLARQLGDAGFARTVAIKLLHPHLATVPDFVRRFLEEARLAARIRHRNVVATIDVVEDGETLCLVMDYVAGESVAALAKRASEAGERVPPAVAIRIVADMLLGLHAAHTATDDAGAPLAIVHRDVSPQNVLVGLDGAAQLLDFGIAKAIGSLQTTAEGQLKGKLRYMAKEQIVDREATPQTDIYAAAVVLWELLAGRPLFQAVNEGALLGKVLEGAVLPPSHFAPGTSELDSLVLRGLERDPTKRPTTAEEMAIALERLGAAPVADVAAWVERLAGAAVREREASVSEGAERGAEGPSDVTATALATPRGRRRGAAIAGVTVVVLAVATFAIAAPRMLRHAPPSPEASSVPSPGSASPAVSVVAPTAVAPAVVAPAAPPTTPSRSTGAPKAKDRAPKVDCTVPYVRDPSGIRRVRRECL